MRDAIELLRQHRAQLKSKGKTLHAHVINNAIQFLQRKQRETHEQRIQHSERVRIRNEQREAVRAQAAVLSAKHAADRAARQQQKLAASNAAQAARDARAKRDAEIVQRVLSGEKRYVLAMEYKVSPGTITRLALAAGIPRFERRRKQP